MGEKRQCKTNDVQVLDDSVSVIGCKWIPVEVCKNREGIITFT